MAHKIYDKDGNPAGTLMSEGEALGEQVKTFFIMLASLAVLALICIVPIIFAVGVWYLAIEDLLEGELEWLFLIIPLLATTILVGKKVLSDDRTTWGVMWRVFVADTLVGIVVLALMGEKAADVVIFGVLYSVAPSAIVALVAYVISKIKERSHNKQ